VELTLPPLLDCTPLDDWKPLLEELLLDELLEPADPLELEPEPDAEPLDELELDDELLPVLFTAA
jgi:hypothetical protein